MQKLSAFAALGILTSLAAVALSILNLPGIAAVLSALAALAALLCLSIGLSKKNKAQTSDEACQAPAPPSPLVEIQEEAPALAPTSPSGSELEDLLCQAQTLSPFLNAILAAIPQTTEDATFHVLEKYEAVRDITTKAANLARELAESAHSEKGNESGLIISHSRETVQAERRTVQAMAKQTRDNTKKLRLVAKELESGLDFVKGIEEITDRSQLIAFNMAIEAAHIGEKGRGFKVIVGELRTLNDRTLEFSQRISGLFSRFRDYTAEMVSSMAEQSDQAIGELEESMAASEKAVESLIGASEEADNFSRELAQDTMQIDKALDSILESLQFQDISRQMVERSRAILAEIEEKLLSLRSLVGHSEGPEGERATIHFTQTKDRLIGKAITRAEREAISEVSR